MEFQIRIHPEQRLTRIPKILAKNFGHVWTLVPNTNALVAFRENEDLETVLKSLNIIQQVIQLRIDSKITKMSFADKSSDNVESFERGDIVRAFGKRRSQRTWATQQIRETIRTTIQEPLLSRLVYTSLLGSRRKQ